MLAETISTIDASVWAPIVMAIIAGLAVLIPLVVGLVRVKITAASAKAEAEAARAQLEALDAKTKLAEAQRTTEAVVKGVEKLTAPLSLEDAKKTKDVFKAMASDLGVSDALNTVVANLGLAKRASRAEIQTPAPDVTDKETPK